MVDANAVAKIINEVAEQAILPFFNRLSPDDVREKRPGDLVTIADTTAERLLTERLTVLLPGSVVVGEESVAGDARTLELLSGTRPVWIIDPVDGTGNFAKGSPVFAVIVALVMKGQTQQGWIHDPLTKRTMRAAVGQGCWCDQRPMVVSVAPPLPKMRGTIGWRLRNLRAESVGEIVNQGSAAHDYLDLLEGRQHFAYYRRLNPWDHAAGVLLHQEAGGYSSLLDGTAYQPLPGLRDLLLSSDLQSWTQLATLFRPPRDEPKIQQTPD